MPDIEISTLGPVVATALNANPAGSKLTPAAFDRAYAPAPIVNTAAWFATNNPTLAAGQWAVASDTGVIKCPAAALPWVDAPTINAAYAPAPIVNTAAWFATNNPTLAAGQWAVASDTGVIKCPATATAWASAPTINAAYAPVPIVNTLAWFGNNNPMLAAGQWAIATDAAVFKCPATATLWASAPTLQLGGGAAQVLQSIPAQLASPAEIATAAGPQIVTAVALAQAMRPVDGGPMSGTTVLDFGAGFALMRTATAAVTISGARGMIPGQRYELRVLGGASGPHVVSFANDCQPQNGTTTVSIATGSIMRARVMQYVGPDGILRTEFDDINVVVAPANHGPILDAIQIRPQQPEPGDTVTVNWSGRGVPAPALAITEWRANGVALAGETSQVYGPIPAGFAGRLEAAYSLSGHGSAVTGTVEAIVGAFGMPRWVGNRISTNNTGTSPVTTTILLPTAATDTAPEVYYALGVVTSQGDVAGSPATFAPPPGFGWLDTPIPRINTTLGDAFWIGVFGGYVTPDDVAAGNIGTMGLGSNSNCNLVVLRDVGAATWFRSINTRSGSLAANSIAIPTTTLETAALLLAIGHSGSAVTQIQTATLAAPWIAGESAQGYGSDGGGRYGSRVFRREVAPGTTPSGTISTTGAATATLAASLVAITGRPRQ